MSKPKPFNRASLLKRVRALLVRIVPLANVAPDDEARKALALTVCSELKVPLTNWSKVLDSMRFMKEGAFTPSKMRKAAFRAAANVDELRAGGVLPDWCGKAPTQGQVEIIGCGRAELYSRRQNKDVLMTRVRMRVLTGHVAGCVFSIFYTPGYCRWLVREIGAPKYERTHEFELAGMRALATFEMNDQKRLIAKLEASPSQRAFNMKLTRQRWDHRPKACKELRACADCPKTVGKCPLACKLNIKPKEI